MKRASKRSWRPGDLGKNPLLKAFIVIGSESGPVKSGNRISMMTSKQRFHAFEDAGLVFAASRRVSDGS